MDPFFDSNDWFGDDAKFRTLDLSLNEQQQDMHDVAVRDAYWSLPTDDQQELHDAAERTEAAQGAWNQDDKYALGQVGWANVASTAVQSIFGAIKGVNAAKHANAMAKIQEQVALNNKRMAQLQANVALMSMNNRISQLTMKYGQIKSKQITGFAANGIKLSSSNVRETLATTDLHKEMDVNAAYRNGIAAAMGYQNKASQAQMQVIAARNSHSNPVEAGVGGLLNAAVKTGTQYWNQKYRYR